MQDRSLQAGTVASGADPASKETLGQDCTAKVFLELLCMRISLKGMNISHANIKVKGHIRYIKTTVEG